GGPLVESTQRMPRLASALAAITAAAVGVILSLALAFAGQLLWAHGQVQWVPALMAAAATVALLRFKVGLLPLLAASGALGIALRLWA
ncbi:chromate transporter, partial [Pelomonas sp. HMWF004]